MKHLATATNKYNAKSMGRTYSETIYPVIDCLREAPIQEIKKALNGAKDSTILGGHGDRLLWRHLMEKLSLLLKEKAESLNGQSIASQQAYEK